MKHGKKPTVQQRKRMVECGIDQEGWLIVKDTPTMFVVVSRTDANNKKVFYKI